MNGHKGVYHPSRLGVNETMIAKHKSLITRTLIGVAALAFVGSANALNFYRGKVDKIEARTSGDVILSFKDLIAQGSGTAAPPADGKARYLIPASETGANKVLAVVMSAVALNSEITLASFGAASSTPQVPYQVVIVAPE
jgi:hypothetical protein